MPRQDAFADRLVQAMTASHMTVAELHETLEQVVSVRTLWRWRSGQAAPGIEALPLLARALTTTPNRLLGWAEEDHHAK